MLKGFKEFISRGNMIDMAVGVVMGSAVTSIVTSIVSHLINPLIAVICGQTDLSQVLRIKVKNFSGGYTVFEIGSILNSVVNFLLVAAAVYFVIIVPMNKFREMSAAAAKKIGKSGEFDAEAEESLSPEEEQLVLLRQIRDELKKEQK